MKILVENKTEYTKEMFIELQRNEWLIGKKKVKGLCYILMGFYLSFAIFSLIREQFPFAIFFLAAGGFMFAFVKKGYFWIAKTAFKRLKKSLPINGYHYLFFEDYVEMKGENDKLIKKISYHQITKAYQTKYSYNFFMDHSFFMVSLDNFLRGSSEEMMKIMGKI